jgi:hypothetical protein
MPSFAGLAPDEIALLKRGPVVIRVLQQVLQHIELALADD